MQFDLAKSVQVLERTPLVLKQLLHGLDAGWLYENEGGESWSPYTVIGHLVHGEKTDWIIRAKIITGDQPAKNFQPFDRFAQLNEDPNKTIDELLCEFEQLRKEGLTDLTKMKIDANKLAMKGIHPEFGEVTLEQLLATWVTHDLGHIAQIARVMAKQYKEAIGPWTKYVTVVNK